MSEVTLSEIERRLAVCEQAVKDLSDKITATDHNLVATTTTLNSVLATLGELKGAVESLKARPATLRHQSGVRHGRCRAVHKGDLQRQHVRLRRPLLRLGHGDLAELA